MNPHEKATDLVGGIFKLLPATSGIMLALIWGLVDFKTPFENILTVITVASMILGGSILLSLLGLQFMVSALRRGNADASSKTLVQVCFFGAWITFIAGSVAVIWSLFLFSPRHQEVPLSLAASTSAGEPCPNVPTCRMISTTIHSAASWAVTGRG